MMNTTVDGLKNNMSAEEAGNFVIEYERQKTINQTKSQYESIKMINLYIDMDSTLFDYQETFNMFHISNTGEDKYHVDWSHYHTHELYGIPYGKRYDYLTQKGFFENMNPYEGAIQVVRSLMEHYNVLFVTNCVVKEAFAEKHDSLKRHFGSKFDIEKLVALKHKHLLQTGIFIEDNPEVITNCLKNGHEVFVMDQPWNKQVEGIRVFNWNEIEKALLKDKK